MKDLEEKLGAFRVGIVSEANPKTGEVRVVFDDLDGLETDELPVLYPKTLKDRYYAMPDVGEHVACLMDEHFETGVVLGAVYDETNLPPESSQDKDYIRWENGTVIEHDRSTGRITIDTPGQVIIRAAGMTIDAPVTVLDDVTVQGGDVVADRISLKTHIHGKVTSGDGKSGQPEG